MSASLGRISVKVGTLSTGLISPLLSLGGSRYNCTLPLALETRTKLLDLSNVSSMPRDTFMCCFCSLCRSSFRGAWIIYATSLEEPGISHCHS